jgi:hypothetical protein
MQSNTPDWFAQLVLRRLKKFEARRCDLQLLSWHAGRYVNSPLEVLQERYIVQSLRHFSSDNYRTSPLHWPILPPSVLPPSSLHHLPYLNRTASRTNTWKSHCCLEVNLHPEGPAIAQCYQGFPWSLSVLGQMLNLYPNSTFLCILLRPSKLHKNFVIMLPPQTQNSAAFSTIFFCSILEHFPFHHLTFFTSQSLTLPLTYLYQKKRGGGDFREPAEQEIFCHPSV